jgi:transposase
MSSYRVILSPEERKELMAIIGKGERSLRIILRAKALLSSDEGVLLYGRDEEGVGYKTNRQISQELGISQMAVVNVKKRYLQSGLQEALLIRPPISRPRPPKFDHEFDQKLKKLALSPPPPGKHKRWTIRLLADHLGESGLVPGGVSYSTVLKSLNKMDLNFGSWARHKEARRLKEADEAAKAAETAKANEAAEAATADEAAKPDEASEAAKPAKPPA